VQDEQEQVATRTRSASVPVLPARPTTVRAGHAALLVSALGWAVAVVLIGPGELIDRQIAKNPARVPAGSDPAAFTEAARTLALFFLALVLALYLLFCWWAWRGRGWARIVLWVVGGVLLAATFPVIPAALAGTLRPPPQWPLGVVALLALITGMVLLAMRPSHDWYRQATRTRSLRRR